MDTIHIKNSWNEVTIGEFMAIQQLRQEDFENDFEYYIRLLGILSDKDTDYFYHIPMMNIPGLVRELSFLSTEPAGELNTSYRINGKKYKVCLDIRNFSAIQYIDLVTLLKDNKDNKNLHLILAILMQESGKKYNTEEYDVMAAAEEIRDHFSIADAYTLSLFFSLLLKSLIRGMQSYSISRMKKKLKKEKDPEKKENLMTTISRMQDLVKSGDGFII
ncbi:MAG: hypothetical protein LUG98_11585 [Tannerellaceae bacterium]|nr:hypothetical protein [Tannerellaceae bacterium]